MHGDKAILPEYVSLVLAGHPQLVHEVKGRPAAKGKVGRLPEPHRCVETSPEPVLEHALAEGEHLVRVAVDQIYVAELSIRLIREPDINRVPRWVFLGGVDMGERSAKETERLQTGPRSLSQATLGSKRA